MKTQSDRRVASDQALLKGCRKTCEIDFIRFIDDPASAAVALPGRQKNGALSSIHSVRPRDLLALPVEVTTRNIQALEVSLDLFPTGRRKGANHTQEELVRVMGDLADMFHRRLAPWASPYVGNRFGIFSGTGKRYMEVFRDRHFSGPFGLQRTLKGDAVPAVISPSRPTLTEGKTYNDTVWFGHKIHPSVEPGGVCGTPPGAQMRMYAKFTDKNTAIPSTAWRFRVEVTLNGSALRDRYGITTIGDLITTGLLPIFKDYFVPQNASRSLLKRSRRNKTAFMVKYAARYFQRQQEIAYESAIAEGPLAVADRSHLIALVPEPRLRRIIFQAAHDFNRSLNLRASAAAAGS